MKTDQPGPSGSGVGDESPRATSEDFPEWDLRRVPIPEDVERAIVTRHSHELAEIGEPGTLYAGQPIRRPLWLIWKRQPLSQMPDAAMDYPSLDAIADNEESARVHYRMAVYNRPRIQVWVERVPANHGFASSLGEWQWESQRALWKIRAERNKREGD